MSAKPFVGQPGVPEALQRVFDTGEGFGFFDAQLRATVQALDLTDHQYLKLQGVNSFGAGGFLPAAVGAASIGTLQNPATSQKLLRVRRMIVGWSSAANQTILFGTLSGAIAPALANVTTLTPSPRDTRIVNVAGGSGQATGRVQLATTLGAPTTGEQLLILGSTVNGAPIIVPLDCTVSPGGWFYAVGLTANLGFAFSVAWDERQTVTSELNVPG